MEIKSLIIAIVIYVAFVMFGLWLVSMNTQDTPIEGGEENESME